MNAGRARDAPQDQEYVDAYTDGYGEGLREALREMLHHASRGHTPGEMRLLIESRLARLRDDIELKRRSLLAPPPRAAYAPLFKSTARPPAPTITASVVAAGGSVLILEVRPDRAVRMLREIAPRYPRVVVVSFHPPAIDELPPGQVTVLKPGVSGAGGDDGLTPDVIAGRIRAATEADAGALVYVDALEVLATGGAIDAMVKFVQWTAQQASKTRSVFLASVAPESFDSHTMSLLRRSFAQEL